MADLDFVPVGGRLGLVVRDELSDLDRDPNVIWCDSGEVWFTPLNTVTKVVGANPVPASLGQSVFKIPLDKDGFIALYTATTEWDPDTDYAVDVLALYEGNSYRRLVAGQSITPPDEDATNWTLITTRPFYLVDLTSPKVNPRVGAGLATHKVEFKNIKAKGTAVTFQNFNGRFASDMIGPNGYCDITLLSPVPGTGGTPVIIGPTGPQGEQGEQGIQGIQGEPGVTPVVVEEDGVYPSRPTLLPVIFVGITNPDTLGLMLPGDVWDDLNTTSTDVIPYVRKTDLDDPDSEISTKLTASFATKESRTINGDANHLLALGTGEAVTDQTNDVYIVTISPHPTDSNTVETSGAGAGAVGFNIGQWILRATDGAAGLTRTREVCNIEHDFIQLEQTGGTATFNKVVSSRFRFSIPKAGVTIVDNKGIDFVVPNSGDVTGAVTNYIAINIPALTGGGGTNHYGIRFNNTPNGGSVVSRNGSLVLKALTNGDDIVLWPSLGTVLVGPRAAGVAGSLQFQGDASGSGVDARIMFGGNNSGNKLRFAKNVGSTITDLLTLDENGAGTLAMGSAVSIGGNGNASFSGTVSASFALTSGGNISSASGGSMRVGTTDTGGGATVVAIRNATVVPTTNTPAGGVLYVESGALKYRGSSGTVTTLGPA